jgi:hypothetical protein
MIELPPDLVEALTARNVVLFLGTIGGVPTWADVARQLAEHCGYADDDQSLPRIAQFYEGKFGRAALLDAVRGQLDGTATEGRAHGPTSLHQLVTQMPWALIVTTNADTLLEDAYRQIGQQAQVVVSSSDVAFASPDQVTIIKLRGDVRQPDSLILTEKDERRYRTRSPLVADWVKSAFATHLLFCVNPDLDDETFKDLFDEVMSLQGAYRRRAHAVHPNPSDYALSYWTGEGMHVHVVDPAEFLTALQNAFGEPPPPSNGDGKEIPPEQPYKFLDWFDVRDAAIFYGRAEDSRRLADMILGNRLVVLYGESGSGKTSLVRAGIKPRLDRQGSLTVVVPTWSSTQPPAATLRDALRAELVASFGPAPSEPDPTADLLTVLHWAQSFAGRRLVLVLDQAEQLLDRVAAPTRQAFLTELARAYESAYARAATEGAGTAAEGRPYLVVDLRLVFAVREDAFVRLDELRQALAAVFENNYRLDRLSREDAREAIVAPVERWFNMRYADALVERLLDDLYDDGVAPPQLQIVCDRLFREFGKPGAVIGLSDYERLHGADGILSGYLEAALAEHADVEQPIAQAALLALVTSQGTRALVGHDELIAATEASVETAEAVIQKLIEQRLVRRLGDTGTEVRYELAHDVLATRVAEWQTEAMRQIKQARELLQRGLADWRAYAVLPSQKEFELIDAQQAHLTLDDDARVFLLRTAVKYNLRVGEWLQRVGDGEVKRKLLLDMLTNEASDARKTAALYLAQVDGAAASEALAQAALQDPDADVRSQAAVSLGRVTGISIQGLTRAVGTGDPEQRLRAIEALARAGDVNPSLRNQLPAALLIPVGMSLGWLRLHRSAADIRWTALGGLIGGAVGFALGLGPPIIWNVIEESKAGPLTFEQFDLLVIAIQGPFYLLVMAILGLIAGAGIGFGASVGRALGPGMPARATGIGAALGGMFGFAPLISLRSRELTTGSRPELLVAEVLLAGMLTGVGATVTRPQMTSRWAVLAGGLVGGALGFVLLGVSWRALHGLGFVWGAIIGLAIAAGIAWGRQRGLRQE